MLAICNSRPATAALQQLPCRHGQAPSPSSLPALTSADATACILLPRASTTTELGIYTRAV
eukprot:355598-Chlamydomonas_euryale.AAC.3